MKGRAAAPSPPPFHHRFLTAAVPHPLLHNRIWFVLTNRPPLPYLGRMTIDSVVRIVQVSYPQVYLACHTRHQRRRSTDHALSTRDSAILVHLDERVPTLPSQLAHHLSVTRSTVSEALKRLTALGYVTRARSTDDRRSSAVLLTAKAARAIRDTSVLETERLHTAIALATPSQRRAIAKGMTSLAAACRRIGKSGRAQ